MRCCLRTACGTGRPCSFNTTWSGGKPTLKISLSCSRRATSSYSFFLAKLHNTVQHWTIDPACVGSTQRWLRQGHFSFNITNDKIMSSVFKRYSVIKFRGLKFVIVKHFSIFIRCYSPYNDGKLSRYNGHCNLTPWL